jgi:fructoselysine-6-P-deglycase FrlB-like protein
MAAAVATAAALQGRDPTGTNSTASDLRDRLAAGIEAAWADPAGPRPATTIGRAIAEASHLLVVGSGVDRVTARELTLKVEEAAYLPSAMRDLETFLHGHLPATGPSTALVLVLTERAGLDARATRGRQALTAAAAVGIRAGAILGASAADRIPGELTPAGRIVIPDAPGLPAASASLFGAAGPLQLVTLAVAEARGTNPDPIRRDDPAYLRAAELADDPSL